MNIRFTTIVVAIGLSVVACNPNTTPSTATTTTDQLFPEVIGVVVTANANGTYRFDVTISSPYDGPTQYADAWRVQGEDGTVYGIRVLTHPHAGEQPFTRSLDGVEIPRGVGVVIVEGRDLINGWGGRSIKTAIE